MTETLQRSAEISQMLSDSNNNMAILKNDLSGKYHQIFVYINKLMIMRKFIFLDVQKDLAETKTKVGNLTTEFRGKYF